MTQPAAGRLTEPVVGVKPLYRTTKTLLSLPGWGGAVLGEYLRLTLSKRWLSARGQSPQSRNDQVSRTLYAAEGSNRA